MQIEQNLKLETIFMPEARKRRAKLYGEYANDAPSALLSKSARFVHYTTAEAALSIIINKCLWMRNATCMADYREVQHGFEILRSYFSDRNREAAFITAVERAQRGLLRRQSIFSMVGLKILARTVTSLQFPSTPQKKILMVGFLCGVPLVEQMPRELL